MENIPNIDIKRIGIHERVEKIKAKALKIEEIEQMHQDWITLVYGKDPSNINEINNIQDKFISNSIIVQTLEEYRMVIEEMTDDQSKINELIAHENAHANLAQSLGAEFLGYSLEISKDDKIFLFKGGAPYRLPEEWSDERKIEAHILITSAPEVYGEWLSDSDKRVVDALKKQKEN